MNADFTNTIGQSKFQFDNKSTETIIGSYSSISRKGAIQNGNKLRNITFAEANLNGVDMSKVSFFNTDFSSGRLKDVNLSHAQFDVPADFSNTEISEVDFSRTRLANSNFKSANLKQVDFSNTDLRKVSFSQAVFNQVEFNKADARDAEFVKSNLENEEFNRTDLRGANFLSSRLYATIFQDVRITHDTEFGQMCIYEKDSSTKYKNNRKNEQISRLEAAEWTYKHLQLLFEQNALSNKAGKAHYRRQVIRRRQANKEGNWVEWIINWINFALTGYGESIRRTLFSAAFLIFVSGLVYSFTGMTDGVRVYRIRPKFEALDLGALEVIFRGFLLSIEIFTGGRFVDLQPVGRSSQVVASIESLGGAALIALFIFVLGRKAVR